MRTRTGPACRRRRGWHSILAAAFVLGGVTALASAPLVAQGRRPTSRPPFPLRADSLAGRDSLLVLHIASLQFDTGPGADHRRLLKKGPGDSLVVGPEVELAPEVGAAGLHGNWAGSGRVLARVTLWREPYPMLHLDTGVTYLVVRRSTQHLVAGDSLWGYWLKVSGWHVLLGDSLSLEVRRPAGPARFILNPGDENVCVPCNSSWCCSKERP